jgi:CheY-like chemotaxis protein
MSDEARRILLVEDNEDDVFALKWAFGKAGVEGALQVVTDGRQALEYLAGEGPFQNRASYPLPSIIFLDLKLPYVTGHEILEWMHERPELRSIEVIVLSGSDENRDHERSTENGARAYLVKPPTPEDIRRVLDAVSQPTSL